TRPAAAERTRFGNLATCFISSSHLTTFPPRLPAATSDAVTGMTLHPCSGLTKHVKAQQRELWGSFLTHPNALHRPTGARSGDIACMRRWHPRLAGVNDVAE